jgi:glycosyltransferase involved in cell wall biosynthesis
MTLASENLPNPIIPTWESRTVSVIIPCRNEAKWIERCLESVAASDFPKERLEVLVVDGMSTDGTPSLVQRFTASHGWARLLQNPRRIAPAALNIGIAEARGAVIMRMDAHNEYPRDYISKLVQWLERSGADNVGGLWITRPSSETAMARAIALGCSHPFGVGNARYRTGIAGPCEADTVPFGCYRREVFDRIGVFDEELVRNQDIEFNLRLRGAGGRILLVPDVASYYHARSSLRTLWRTHFQNGYFNVRVIQKTHGHVTFRQIIPPLFVLALLTTGILAPWSKWTLAAFLAVVAAYLIPLIAFSLAAAFRQGAKIGLALAAVFPVLHFSSGLGTLKGMADFLVLRKRITPVDVKSVPLTRDSEFVHGVLSSSPRVSVIMPCRNEAGAIRPCLESILATDFPKDRLEVLVVDGMSDDGTRAVVEETARRCPVVRLVDNPRKITPAALNAGIAAAKGEIIMRVDAHYQYPVDYISRLVRHLQESGADNVGGIVKMGPANDTVIATAIAVAVCHPFGIGNAHYRLGVTKPRWVDTVPFGCYRKEVFDRIGLYDEQLVRNQDIELNRRLVRHGGKILLVPDVVLHGHARDSFRKLCRMYYQYGYFNPLVIWKSRIQATARQIVTPLFVSSVLVTAALAPWLMPARWLLAAIAAAYSAPLLCFSAAAAVRHGWRCGLALLAIFPALHFSHGLGFLRGAFDCLVRRRKRGMLSDATPLTR